MRRFKNEFTVLKALNAHVIKLMTGSYYITGKHRGGSVNVKKNTKDGIKGETEELRRLIDNSSSLMAALIIMLALLLSASLPKSMLELVYAVAQPLVAADMLNDGKGKTAAEATEDPYVYIRLADVDDDVGSDILIRLIGIEKSSEIMSLAGSEPSILIYHTHDTEAYRKEENSDYIESGNCRTEDERYNVYAVGEELCRILREKYGIIAIHASEQHEKPLITTAYSRSLETMRKYKQEYPSINMFIDIHRDGVADTGYENDFVTVDGIECARMMFVVGTGKSGKSSQYAPSENPDTVNDMPDFESNYALAARLTETLLSYNERFMRNINVKSGKYNQQMSDKCLLVEVGHNGNTLQQAKNSMYYLAKAIAGLGE